MLINQLICEDFQDNLKNYHRILIFFDKGIPQRFIYIDKEKKSRPMTMKKKDSPDIIFADLKGDSQATVIQSLCVQCEENGITTLLMTKIPFFRQVILTSFLCENCGFKNNQVQFAGKLPDFGIQISYKALTIDDLDRQIIKSEHANITIEELLLEIPQAKRSEVTTFQGLLDRIQQELKMDQPQRKIDDLQKYQKIQAYIVKIKKAREGEILPLTLKLKDPSGNSIVKNPFAPKTDKNLQISQFKRSQQELLAMGYSIQNAQEDLKNIQQKNLGNKLNFTKPFEQSSFLHHQPVIFDVPCSSCMMPGQMKMCQTSVPYFTDLVIMSFICEYCGMHSVQTKDGGEIHKQAIEITLKVESQKDLKRDLFKSQTCAVNLPEIQLQLDYGTLGGQYTTVEGLLQKIHDHLKAHNPFGDSDQEFGGRMQQILKDLKLMQDGHKSFTLILIDPLSRTFLHNPYDPEQDKNAKRVFRPRTQQEDQFLGLDGINVDNYQKG